MIEDPRSSAKARVLHAAEQLFGERGYTAVTLRDIADALGMRTASLYNHAPDGKEALFVAVTERNLLRHQHGIEQAAQGTEQRLEPQLRAIANWLYAHPPLHLPRMRASDMPALTPTNAERLTRLVYTCVLAPIDAVVQHGVRSGEADPTRARLLAGVFIAAVEAFRNLEPYTGATQAQQVDQIIHLLLDGVRPR
jgi:TetR/AcrR family transcriptional regulator, cholesterol catabolism regulator